MEKEPVLQSGGCFNPLIAAIVHDMITSGSLTQHLQNLNQIYSDRSKRLFAAFRKHFNNNNNDSTNDSTNDTDNTQNKNIIEFTEPKGGYFGWLKVLEPKNFDTEKFQQLDKDIKDKCFKEKIVKEEIFYSLTKDKDLIENIKNKSEFNEIKNLIEEKRKEASFSVSFWQNKDKDSTKVDIIEDNSSKDNVESNSFKKWIKKIF